MFVVRSFLGNEYVYSVNKGFSWTHDLEKAKKFKFKETAEAFVKMNKTWTFAVKMETVELEQAKVEELMTS